MKFQYPILIWICFGGLALLVAALFLLRRHTPFRGGVRAANTAFIKKIPAFKKAMRLNLLLSLMLLLFLGGAVVSGIFLAARPYRIDKVATGERRRDIFLCMDTGFYLDHLNSQLIEALIGIVQGAKGDRFGISIYSSSSYLLVPLTDDYDFVVTKLKQLEEYFELGVKMDQYYGQYAVIPDELQEEYDADYQKLLNYQNEFSRPTSIDEYRKQPFLVGDGLASCLYSFPDLKEQDRSRVIILSTDNTEAIGAQPICTLSEAADLCAKYDVTVFGLFRGKAAFEDSLKPTGAFLHEVPTDVDYDEAKKDLKENVLKTDGSFYEYGESMSVDQIVKDIQSKEAMQVDEIVTTRSVDLPAVPVIILVICVSGTVFLSLRMLVRI